MEADHLMVREQCVALHVVELAVVWVWQLRGRRGNVLRGIQAQQVVEPRLHLVPSPIPVIAFRNLLQKINLVRLGMAVSGSTITGIRLDDFPAQSMHCVAESLRKRWKGSAADLMGSCSCTSRKVRPRLAEPCPPCPSCPPLSLAPSLRSCWMSLRDSERPVPSYLHRMPTSQCQRCSYWPKDRKERAQQALLGAV